MNRRDLENVRVATEVLSGKLDALLDQGPRILVVTVSGRVVNIRSTDPTVKVDVLELDAPEGHDPEDATTRKYPFDIY
jgi:hypothetical protein